MNNKKIVISKKQLEANKTNALKEGDKIQCYKTLIIFKPL